MKDFYPRVIPDDLFYRVQSALKDRKYIGVVERSEGRNLFAGLVYSREGISYIYHGHGKEQSPTLARSDGMVGNHPYQAVVYSAFERVLLRYIYEIQPADLGPKRERAGADRLAEVQGKLAEVEFKIREFGEALYADPKSKTYKELLSRAEADKEKLLAEYQQARQAVASPMAVGVGEAKTLIALLEKDKSQELRLKLRAKIASIVEEIRLDMQRAGVWKVAVAEVRFKHSPTVRTIWFAHKPRRAGRGYVSPEQLRVVSAVETETGVFVQSDRDNQSRRMAEMLTAKEPKHLGIGAALVMDVEIGKIPVLKTVDDPSYETAG